MHHIELYSVSKRQVTVYCGPTRSESKLFRPLVPHQVVSDTSQKDVSENLTWYTEQFREGGSSLMGGSGKGISTLPASNIIVGGSTWCNCSAYSVECSRTPTGSEAIWPLPDQTLGGCVLVLGYSLKATKCKNLSTGNQIHSDQKGCTPDGAGVPSFQEGRALTPCHFTCRDSLEMINDKSSCNAFHLCLPDGPLGPITCPGNTYFHWESQTCVEDSGVCCSVSCTPMCTSVGVQIPDPIDCARFYVCVETGQPSEDVHLTCPSGTFFDAETHRCLADVECEAVCAPGVTTTSAAPCTPFCSTAGVQIADPNDCTKFYICIEQGFPDEDVHGSCRPTEHFDPETGRCAEGGECVSQCGASTGPTDTTSVSESTGTDTIPPETPTTIDATPPSETTTPTDVTSSEATTTTDETPSETTTPTDVTSSEATTTTDETPSETTTPIDVTSSSETTTTTDTTTPS
ncbi:mucin-2-like [Penaeus indicus]|uniref:mucin-2-like n=1 Tax=Penaeus indicus TaxID=29960 RepID=UPI00300C94D4